MRAFEIFNLEIRSLSNLVTASKQAYIQTKLLYESELEFPSTNIEGHGFVATDGFVNKMTSKLNQLVYVRIISALEVYLVDTIKDVFVYTKEPFLNEKSIPQLTQSELLSAMKISKVYEKIINKKCRNLSGKKFTEVARYYEKTFGINVLNMGPGKREMEKYHDIRNLLVHRLGRLDDKYREKYGMINSKRIGVPFNEDLLYSCLEDCKRIVSQINAALSEKISLWNKGVVTMDNQNWLQLDIEIKGANMPECLSSEFCFWVGDRYSVLKDIEIERKNFSETKLRLILRAESREVTHYQKILKNYRKRKKLNVWRKTIIRPEERDVERDAFPNISYKGYSDTRAAED